MLMYVFTWSLIQVWVGRLRPWGSFLKAPPSSISGTLREKAMDRRDKQRWLRGYDILNLGVRGFELPEAVKTSKLNAYDSSTGKNIVDVPLEVSGVLRL